MRGRRRTLDEKIADMHCRAERRAAKSETWRIISGYQRLHAAEERRYYEQAAYVRTPSSCRMLERVAPRSVWSDAAGRHV
jgi:hypothetical protein